MESLSLLLRTLPQAQAGEGEGVEVCRRELWGRAPSGEESAGLEGTKKKLSENLYWFFSK